MARKALLLRNLKKKYEVQVRNRCIYCGRGRGYIGDFKMCRICFRKNVNRGRVPGIKKSSW